jgi:hypothetical protein
VVLIELPVLKKECGATQNAFNLDVIAKGRGGACPSRDIGISYGDLMIAKSQTLLLSQRYHIPLPSLPSNPMRLNTIFFILHRRSKFRHLIWHTRAADLGACTSYARVLIPLSLPPGHSITCTLPWLQLTKPGDGHRLDPTTLCVWPYMPKLTYIIFLFFTC